MTEQHQQPHRNLIGVLLTYPDRAMDVLNKNQTLVSDDFVKLLEAMSLKMADAGNQKAAAFLQTLAKQIRKEFLSVVLQVGQETITASETIARLTRYQMLPQFLSEIVIDQAIAQIECTPQEKAIICQRFYEQNQINDEAQRQAWCAHHHLTQQQLEELAIRPLKIQKFQQATWENKKIEAYFLERKDDLDRVCYSLIRVKNGALAQELYFRLEEGEESFAQIAKKYTQGPEAQNGGLVGPISMKMPHPIIARILKGSKLGQISQPIRIEDWYVIVRLEKFIPAQLNDSTRKQLLNELFQTWLSQEINRKTIALSPAQIENAALESKAIASVEI
jgi:parvulin-like peptidyl-prolyl isomerase